MMQWKSNKGYTVRETERYIRTYFVDTKYNRIMLIEDKEDHDMDRIKIVRRKRCWYHSRLQIWWSGFCRVSYKRVYEIKSVKSPGSKKPGFFILKL